MDTTKKLKDGTAYWTYYTKDKATGYWLQWFTDGTYRTRTREQLERAHTARTTGERRTPTPPPENKPLANLTQTLARIIHAITHPTPRNTSLEPTQPPAQSPAQ